MMNNLTKMKIFKPVNEVFEAFVDPAKIVNFWFSSSSERWEQGKTITLKYEEYNAQVDIKVKEVELNQKIVFCWGTKQEENIVTLTLKEWDSSTTIIEVNEEGFKESDPDLIRTLVSNKEGWVYMLTCLKGYLEHGVQLRAALVF